MALLGHNPVVEELVEALTGDPVFMPALAIAVIDPPDVGFRGRFAVTDPWRNRIRIGSPVT
jgi:phosphohistidine phosphatase SixA